MDETKKMILITLATVVINITSNLLTDWLKAKLPRKMVAKKRKKVKKKKQDSS